jgi:hypothetical protein
MPWVHQTFEGRLRFHKQRLDLILRLYGQGFIEVPKLELAGCSNEREVHHITTALFSKAAAITYSWLFKSRSKPGLILCQKMMAKNSD